MRTAAEILREVRDYCRNPFAWPGGYPRILVTDDGETLCPHCAKKEYRRISQSTRNGDRDGWGAQGVQIHWEGPPEACANCGQHIPSAYGDPEEEEHQRLHEPPRHLDKLEVFFWNQSGTIDRTRREKEARSLAEAARWALEEGVRFTWEVDEFGADIQNEKGEMEHFPAVRCLADHPDGRHESLHGIAESEDEHERNSYRRIVEAELALEMRG